MLAIARQTVRDRNEAKDLIGIQDIADHIPDRRVDLTEQSIRERFGLERDFLREKTGFVCVSRKAESEEASDLAIPAVEKLFARTGLDASDVEYLVFVSQNPDGHGLPHTSSLLHERLALPSDCPVFDISLGCSGWVHGAIVLQALMTHNGYRNGILVTCDPYSKVISDADRDTFVLFGDGATATLMSDRPQWMIGATDLGTESVRNQALNVGAEGRLEMRGREVFNFAAKNVPTSIENVLRDEGITMDDVDRVILHQGSKYIVDAIARRIGATGKAPFVAAEYGNTVSSAVPMAINQALKPEDQTLVVSGFGVGLAWATAVLRRAESQRQFE